MDESATVSDPMSETARAETDLIEIGDFIAKDSPAAAERFVAGFVTGSRCCGNFLKQDIVSEKDPTGFFRFPRSVRFFPARCSEIIYEDLPDLGVSASRKVRRGPEVLPRCQATNKSQVASVSAMGTMTTFGILRWEIEIGYNEISPSLAESERPSARLVKVRMAANRGRNHQKETGALRASPKSDKKSESRQ